MIRANLELSKNEFDTITNSEFILTKNRITEKIYLMFGNLSEVYKKVLNNYKDVLPAETFLIAPKIYKGEQYLNLPYVMMDYPRIFSKKDVFALRCFFWWGNYFSITLHLSGKYLDLFAPNIASSLNYLQKEEWFFGVNENEWEHHFLKDNYIPFENLKAISFNEFAERRFVKIAKKLNLENWQTVEEFYTSNYKKLLKLVTGGQLTS